MKHLSKFLCPNVAETLNFIVYIFVSTLNDTSIEDTIRVGAAPTGVAYESANNLAYVTNLQNGTVSAISGNTVTDIIEVEGNPFGVATNTVNTKVYVTSGADNNFVSVIDDVNI